jgi:hypothetical protein
LNSCRIFSPVALAEVQLNPNNIHIDSIDLFILKHHFVL